MVQDMVWGVEALSMHHEMCIPSRVGGKGEHITATQHSPQNVRVLLHFTINPWDRSREISPIRMVTLKHNYSTSHYSATQNPDSVQGSNRS